MILFFHGLDSSAQTNKFEVINNRVTLGKVSETVDYRNMSHDEVSEFYDDLIAKHSPDLIVGHSLGGYWAIKKSNEHGIPCVLINPSLSPNVFDDYPAIDKSSLDLDIPRGFHIELGDEVLDMVEVAHFAEDIGAITYIYEHGCHRVKYLQEINNVIEHIQAYR